MKKRILILLLLPLLLLFTACGKPECQEDGHIDTIELADKYFPKYFQAVEESLEKNNIQYEKEYSELLGSDISKYANGTKCYKIKYHILETLGFNFTYWFDYPCNDIECVFYYKTPNEDDLYNIPEKYINVMMDVVNFCSHNYLGTGKTYYSYYEKMKDKLSKGDTNSQDDNYFDIYVQESESKDHVRPSKGIEIKYQEEIYLFRMYLYDYLTDINIWDNNEI